MNSNHQSCIRLNHSISRRQLVGGMAAAAVTLPLFSLAGKESFAAESGSASSDIADGTYSSTQPGVNGDVTVSVTISGGKIADVELADNLETPGIGGFLHDKDDNVVNAGGKTPCELLPELIVENNSINLDVVSGATITSSAILNGVEDCIEQAGGTADDFGEPVAYEPNKDAEADVVVVGGGGAGLVAAIASAQQGKTVAIIEKNGCCGGDTLVCGGIYNCPDNGTWQSSVEMTDSLKSVVEEALAATSDDPDKQKVLEEMQAAVREQWDEYLASGRTDLFDTKEWYALQTWLGGDMVADPELVKVLTYNAYDDLGWLEDIGWEVSSIGQAAGALWQRSHLTNTNMRMGTGLISVYFNQLTKYADQISVFTESTATELVLDGSKVAGVTATNNHDGSSFTVTAHDGVILSTGGFSANAKMVQENNTSGKWPDLSTTATTNRFSCSQGEGIELAKAAGASFTDMDQIQLLFLGNVVDGSMTKYMPRDLNGTDQIISINKEGKRFVQEDGRRDQICTAVLQQPDKMFYMLESGDGDGYVDIHSEECKSGDGFSFDYLVDNGFVYWDDTLEGLAGKLEIDPDTLQETVDAFNEAVDTGDDEFGRKLFSCKLENGPWVATPRQACIHHTMGGVTIDTSAHVLDPDGNPIEGLYAAGEVTGGIHGANRLGGNAVVDTVVFGNLAATTLVSES